ncbi:MAG: type IX secretion system sortase PorU, partial [Saprospiraceae bacterium]|nr:type IX secretion system sortase PorU [Bacteroidia bacterium]NNL92019.1 type IX secretion system sortase PorU [Saprospiraceae bacterium]
IVPGLEYQNFVPTYQTDESLHPVEAFPSDDFFALLSDQEGEDSLDGALDIGVGRIPAKTLSEATGVIDKIIHYDTSKKTLGDWKLRIGFTADDEDSNTHIKQADGIAKLVENINPEMNQQKVYFDAFNQEATPGGARYPDANNALNTNLLNGQLVLNYLGHGGPKGWAQERVFQISDIANLKNIDRLPLLITATCSFTGFDEPAFVSAGEQSLLNPSGGAIGLFSTVRAVYSSQNERITREVFKKIFNRIDGKALRFGDIIRESQNANSSDTLSSNTRKFLLFGDPAQRLALPQQKVQITQVNDEDIEAGQIDTIGALGRLKLAGQITDHQDNLISDFNGEVFLTVFDKPSNLKTLDNDGEDRIYDFTLRKNILYKGSASVQNGLYEIELILPKDINFDYGPGHFSLYATDNISRDAGGLYNGIVIGGTSEGGITDNEGPEIDIYFDDRTFTFGGQTGKNPVLIVDLSDETGINLSSTSIGHDITATFDNDNNNNLILNEYYQPQVDKVGSGSIEFQLSEFEPGLHTLTLKAWDILNNSSEKLSEFLVVQNEEGFINNVYNYPNPFSTQTNFTFEHDLGNSNLDIVINIFTVSGKLVKTIQTQRFASGSLINDVPWNANDDFESKLAKGIYFYKINISSPELNLRRESDFQKLVILN